MDWCYKHTRRHSAEVLSGTGTHIVVPTRLVSEAEIIVSVMEKRLSFAGMSVSAMEMNASMNECFHEGDNGVRLDEGSVRGAERPPSATSGFFSRGHLF